MRSARFWLTRVHRWTGLALVVFLLVVGFTGALLPFQGDLQQLLSPTPPAQIVRPPASGARALDWPVLRVIAERRTGGVIDQLPLHREPGEPASFSITAAPGSPPLVIDQIMLDPYTGREIARHRTGDVGPFLGRIMPFLYELHVSLALGDWGIWLLGIAAFAWSIDCFVGFYLTLPAAPHGWWRHWRQAWRLRLPPRSAFRFNFDLHRVAGLWLWPLLFIFAWSSVGMNMRTVYDPVMHTIFGFKAAPPLDRPHQPPTLGWDAALQAARTNAAAEATRRGITIERERALYIGSDDATYSYVVRTSRDRSTDYANSWFTIDGDTGRVIHVELPTGEKAGATVDYWLGILHTAGIFGLPYRILVSLTGVAIVALSITGVLIWNRKRRSRAYRASRTGRTGQITAI